MFDTVVHLVIKVEEKDYSIWFDVSDAVDKSGGMPLQITRITCNKVDTFRTITWVGYFRHYQIIIKNLNDKGIALKYNNETKMADVIRA
jgi:hypothetical protein